MNVPRMYPGWIIALITFPFLALAVVLGLLAVRGLVKVQVTNTNTVTHSLILDKIQDVAKLISTEYHLRDVVVYENTWYGSTKKSLVVATGRILAGIDLRDRVNVTISGAARKIRIRLPHAAVLSSDVTNLQTYDETRGWWNPFSPTDRDEIYRLVRGKFAETAKELHVRERAEQSAKQLLETMFSRDGYSVEVAFE